MRKAIGVLWCVASILGSVALMTHVTRTNPVVIPLAFAACICIAIGGADLISNIWKKP